MICLNCLHAKTNVVNSRNNKKTPTVWRRRKCPSCDSTFSTQERLTFQHGRPVIQKNGKKEPFKLSRLTIDIARSFLHDQQKGDACALELAKTVEVEIYKNNSNQTVDHKKICSITHGVLNRFDKVAALNYASRHQLVSLTKKVGRPSIKIKS